MTCAAYSSKFTMYLERPRGWRLARITFMGGSRSSGEIRSRKPPTPAFASSMFHAPSMTNAGHGSWLARMTSIA